MTAGRVSPARADLPAPLRVEGLTVEYGATKALDDLTVQFGAGRVIGLLGHNGAGKSTLLGAATGAVRPTRGRVLVDGVAVPPTAGPARVAAMGVTVVHQVPALVDQLSVLDNLFLRQEHVTSPRSRRARAVEALAQVGRPDLELDTPVSVLGLGDRQAVALARGFVAGQIRALLLDEPTAALGQQETDALHALIREIARQSATVVYVSHRLPDILEVCDDVVVLRDGALVMTASVADLTMADLAEALAPGTQEQARVPTDPGEVRLQVTAAAGQPPMTFRAGEVVGLFGVAAGEQFALVDALQGRHRRVEATLDGHPYAPGSPAAAIRAGVHTVSADRDQDGLVATMSARDNVYLPWFAHRRTFAGPHGRLGLAEHYRYVRERLHIHGPGGASPVSAFSGGNRQKHLIASWVLPVVPRVLLLSQPTQGVDLAAKADIRHVVRTMAAAGVCVVVASAESDEIAGLCDRAYVMTHGTVREIEHSPGFDAALLAALLAGGPTRKEVVR